MTANGRIGRMKNRPRAHDGHGSQEQIFDLKQIAIAKHGLQRSPTLALVRSTKISVEPRLFGEFAGVDFKRPVVFVLAFRLPLVPTLLRR